MLTRDRTGDEAETVNWFTMNGFSERPAAQKSALAHDHTKAGNLGSKALSWVGMERTSPKRLESGRFGELVASAQLALP